MPMGYVIPTTEYFLHIWISTTPSIQSQNVDLDQEFHQLIQEDVGVSESEKFTVNDVVEEEMAREDNDEVGEDITTIKFWGTIILIFFQKRRFMILMCKIH